jgi:hypothetical protein
LLLKIFIEEFSIIQFVHYINIFKLAPRSHFMADGMLMYAITTAAFIGFVIILGASRGKRYRHSAVPVVSSENKKVKYSSDGKPMSD